MTATDGLVTWGHERSLSLSNGAFRLAIVMLIAVAWVCHVNPAFAQPDAEKDPLSWDRKIHQVVRRFCVDCHNDEEANGNVNLAQDQDIRLILEHRRTWETALAVVEQGEMPPEDARQPSSRGTGESCQVHPANT